MLIGGRIPAGSTLIFDTELVDIQGVEKEERVVKESKTEAEDPKVEEEPVAETKSEAAPEETKKDEL